MTPFMPRVLNARIASKHLRKVAPFASMLMECMICFITRTFQAEVTLTPVTLCSFDRRNYRFPMCTSLWAWYLPNYVHSTKIAHCLNRANVMKRCETAVGSMKCWKMHRGLLLRNLSKGFRLTMWRMMSFPTPWQPAVLQAMIYKIGSRKQASFCRRAAPRALAQAT